MKDASCGRKMLVELKGETHRRVFWIKSITVVVACGYRLQAAVTEGNAAFVYGVGARAATKGEAMILDVNETTC